MPTLIKPKPVEVEIPRQHPLIDLAIIVAAGLFVSILLMTYGLDLSPGFF